MSATRRVPRRPALRRPVANGALPRPSFGLVSLALACVLGPVLWLGAEPPALAARAGEPTGLALGTDGTLLIAGGLRAAGLPPLPAIWAASWAALPILAALPLRAPVGRARASAVGVALACHPLSLLACASGYGWAAVGFYALWSAFLGLPDRTPHQGLVRLGLGVLAAMVFCPDPWALFLPLFAVLFLAAPRAMAARHMPAVYLLAFVPVAGWTLTLAYAGWRSGAAGAGALERAASTVTLGALPFPAALVLAGALCVAVAPGLARRPRARPAAAAVLAACALLATGDGTPLALALLGAAMAQGARTARGGSLAGLALGMIAAAPLSLSVA